MNKKIMKLLVFGLTCAAAVQLPLTAAQSAPKLDASAYQVTWHTADIAAYDKIQLLALDMADFFSLGLIRGFPQEFTGNAR